jgi:hypothetical protein
LLVVLLAAPAFPATARAAQDDGVHIDPGSPAATEYALPLDSARGVGAGAEGASAAAVGAKQEAFGSGITPRADAKAGSRSPGGSTAQSGSGGSGGPTRTGGGDGDGTGAGANLPTSSVGDGDGTALLYSLGGADVVLAAGGLVALTLRRRQSPT